MAIILGDSKSLKAVVLPVGAPQAVEWSTSDSSIFEVEQNGSVVTRGAGTADAIATTPNGKTASCKVTVKAPDLKSVTFNKESKLARIGQKDLYLEVIPTPFYANAEGGTWATSEETVTVDQEGNLTVVGPINPMKPNCTVTYTVGGLKAECLVTLMESSEGVEVTGIDPEGVTRRVAPAAVGVRLRNPVEPETASDMRFEWKFEDPDSVVNMELQGEGPYTSTEHLRLVRRDYDRAYENTVIIFARPLGKPDMEFVKCGELTVEGRIRFEE